MPPKVAAPKRPKPKKAPAPKGRAGVAKKAPPKKKKKGKAAAVVAPAVVATPAVSLDFTTLNKDQLKALLITAGLPISGTNGVLRSRIINSLDTIDFTTFTVAQLQDLVRTRGILARRTKAEVDAQLRANHAEPAAVDPSRLTADRLRILLARTALAIGGRKDALVARVNANFGTIDWAFLKLPELQALVRSRGLRDEGEKSDLIRRLDAT